MKKLVLMICVLLVFGMFLGGCTTSDPNNQQSGCGGCTACNCGGTDTTQNSESNMQSTNRNS